MRQVLGGLVAAMAMVLGGILAAMMMVAAVSSWSSDGTAQQTRRVLTAADFEYLGAFKLPIEVTGWGKGGLTHRYVNGQLRFYVTGHDYENNPVFEIARPDTLGQHWSTAPRATLVRRLGDIYGGKKASAAGDGGSVWTTDLEAFGGLLYWTFENTYNTAGIHFPSLGAWSESAGAIGPWTTDAHPALTQGYITAIPQWYADAHTGGKRLAVGAGLSSGNIRSSWGPNLRAVGAPTSGSGSITTQVLVEYSYDNRMTRSSDYIPHSGDRPGGVWTQEDFIEGAVWVDLPDVHGVMFFGGLGVGNTWYGLNPSSEGWLDACHSDQGPHAEGTRKKVWWIYDPMTFVPVSKQAPYAIRPTTVMNAPAMIEGACFGAAHGATLDTSTRTLYVLYPETEPTDAGNLPIVYAFRIRGADTTTTDPPADTPPAPIPDTQPPTVPANIRFSTQGTAAGNVLVQWDRSADNVGVARYELVRDGVQVGTSPSSEPFNEDGPIVDGRIYQFQVRAVDAAGNKSALSAAVAYSTTAPPSTPAPTPATYQVVEQSFTAASQTVACPADRVVVSGGGFCSNANIRSSRPSGNGWQVTCTATGSGRVHRAYAVCSAAGK